LETHFFETMSSGHAVAARRPLSNNGNAPKWFQAGAFGFNVSSLASVSVSPMSMVDYPASKGAVDSFSKLWH